MLVDLPVNILLITCNRLLSNGRLSNKVFDYFVDQDAKRQAISKSIQKLDDFTMDPGSCLSSALPTSAYRKYFPIIVSKYLHTIILKEESEEAGLSLNSLSFFKPSKKYFQYTFKPTFPYQPDLEILPTYKAIH